MSACSFTVKEGKRTRSTLHQNSIFVCDARTFRTKAMCVEYAWALTENVGCRSDFSSTFTTPTNPDEIRRVGSTAVSLWSFGAMDFQGLKMVFQLLSRWHSSMLTLKHMFPQSHINTDDQKAVAEPHQAAFNRGKHAIHKKEAHSGSTVSLLGLIFTVLLLGFSCFPLFLWSLHYKHKQRVSVSAHTGD